MRSILLRQEKFVALGVAFLTMAVNYGSRSTFGLFLKPLEEEFTASRASVSFILSVIMITYGTLAFFTGYLVDRVGARVVLLIGGASAGMAYLISCQATSLLQVTISLGVLFGVATCFLSQITALSLFVKFPSGANSLALGLVGSAPGIGSLLLSPFMGAMITYGSWRSAMEILGGLFLVYLLLPLLLLRQEKGKRSSRQTEWVKRSGQGLWSGKKLYLLFSSFLLMSLAIYGVLSQEVACATDQGISLTEAAWALGLVTGIGVISSPLLGWIADRIPSKKKMGAWILALATVGILFVFMARSVFLLALGSIIVGTAYASYVPIFPSITRALFGSDFFGRAWGFVCMGGSMGAALGSWLGGYLHDLRGNYDLVWLVMALSFLAAASTLLMVDDAAKEEQRPGQS